MICDVIRLLIPAMKSAREPSLTPPRRGGSDSVSIVYPIFRPTLVDMYIDI